jgi:hypothetical protein
MTPPRDALLTNPEPFAENFRRAPESIAALVGKDARRPCRAGGPSAAGAWKRKSGGVQDLKSGSVPARVASQ